MIIAYDEAGAEEPVRPVNPIEVLLGKRLIERQVQKGPKIDDGRANRQVRQRLDPLLVQPVYLVPRHQGIDLVVHAMHFFVRSVTCFHLSGEFAKSSPTEAAGTARLFFIKLVDFAGLAVLIGVKVKVLLLNMVVDVLHFVLHRA